MRRTSSAIAIAVLCAVAALFAQTTGDDLQVLYRTRQWFELRASVRQSSPSLIRGAVLNAFNDAATAAHLLRGVIRSQPRSDAANAAYGMLNQIYLRSGQYRRLITNLDAWSAASPNTPELREARDDIEKFRGLPDQSNGPARRATLRHEDDSFSLPVSINGKPNDYLFDTGAWLSAMTEAETRRLGLTIRDTTGVLTGASGQTITFRTAVAKEVVVGAVRFHDVSFGVIPTSAEIGDAELGVLGMPVLLGLGNIRWSQDGTVEIGGTAVRSPTAPNLVFDRHRLLLSAKVLGRDVLTTLDTGAIDTDLNANFATLFSELVERTGTKGTQDITGVGGTQTFDAITLPEVMFTIGGTAVGLRPAAITLQRVPGMGGECCVGNAGHDLLTQGQGFSIDFSMMTLRLQ